MSGNLLKNTSFYLIASVINAAIPFALLPILTNYLSPDEYGIIAIASILISFLGPIIGLSVQGAITRNYFTLDLNAFKEYLGNSIFIAALSSLFCFSFFLLFKTPIAILCGVPDSVILFVVCISFFQLITIIFLTLLQVMEKPVHFGLFQIGISLFNFGLSYVFIIHYHQSWNGRLNGWLLATGIFAFLAFLFILFWIRIRFTIKREYIKDILRFSLPLIPHSIGGIVIGLSDRLIINNVLGLTETGIYTIAFQIGSILNILLWSFNNAFVPWLFHKLKLEDDRLKLNIVQLTYYIMFGIVILVVIGYFLAPIVFKYFVGIEFQGAQQYMIWMLLAFGFNGAYYLVTNYIFYSAKTEYLGYTTSAIALINVPLCYVFALNFGLLGAVQATVIAHFLLFTITWLLSARLYPMPWRKAFIQTIKFKKLEL